MEPLGLLEFTRAFDTDEKCRSFLEEIRWPDGPTCPHCSSKKVYKYKSRVYRRGLYVCGECEKQFTVTVGTIFEDTHLPLPKWFLAIYLISYSKKGISANQLAKMLGTTYKTAWHLNHRIRHCMEHNGLQGLLTGTVEVDETYVGGKPRKGNNKPHKRGRGTDKAPVVALVERNGNAVSHPVERVDAKTLKGAIRETVSKDSVIMTDEWKSYRGLDREFAGHQVVKHGQGQFVDGFAFTNTAESFFSLLKRGVYGVFHHVSKKHLHRYCNEFAFRWNCRKQPEDYAIAQVIKRSEGRRLYYRTPKSQGARGLTSN
jgi:transposase-like protein